MGNYAKETAYVEAQLMLAALHEDEEEVARLVHDMMTGELETIDDAMGMISRAITNEYRNRRMAGQRTP